MRLLFAAMAAHGHTYPLVPLAQAAVRAGHDVVFAAGAQFVPVLHAAGLPAVPAGMSLPEALEAATAAGVPAGDRHVGHALGQLLAGRWAEDLTVLLARHCTELLIHDVTTFGAALAGAKAGIPVLGHTFGRVDPGPTWKMIMWVFAGLADEAGVDAEALLHGGRVFDICPDSVQAQRFLATADRIPLRPVGWSPPGAPPPVRRRPLVYLTLGTAFATTELLRQCLYGLATLPVDVLVTTGPAVPAAALGAVPGNVRVESWVAQQDLLPRADLVVHHGGSGTMLGAFQAGLPQLLLPRAADQFGNAEAVLTAGAGARLLPDDVTSQAVAALAESLLADPAPRAAARRIAAEIGAMPSPDRVIAELTG
ncbi:MULTISPECIES: glycosyltransferase [unclassified Crossiella]|uniref:glycosyltransferase n=1 Tax=unclassified Crossiella TaxID=2620835 RepID=UPI001FFEBBDE|nr:MULTISPECIES: nucleotide disphospho-sugar-binding domain-containing protein [unclassified Crossiella]MCK2244430.1 glycosyltransferase [Crossiella sp. S99.2]MCK2257742.1 glycosyltransferase [Crossiella sp. S99.1]